MASSSWSCEFLFFASQVVRRIFAQHGMGWGWPLAGSKVQPRVGERQPHHLIQSSWWWTHRKESGATLLFTLATYFYARPLKHAHAGGQAMHKRYIYPYYFYISEGGLFHANLARATIGSAVGGKWICHTWLWKSADESAAAVVENQVNSIRTKAEPIYKEGKFWNPPKSMPWNVACLFSPPAEFPL